MIRFRRPPRCCRRLGHGSLKLYVSPLVCIYKIKTSVYRTENMFRRQYQKKADWYGKMRRIKRPFLPRSAFCVLDSCCMLSPGVTQGAPRQKWAKTRSPATRTNPARRAQITRGISIMLPQLTGKLPSPWWDRQRGRGDSGGEPPSLSLPPDIMVKAVRSQG